MSLPTDPQWPRAAHWLERADSNPDLLVLGVPAHETSISPTNAHLTPAAVRAGLLRYSTFHITTGHDISDLNVYDAGDVDAPDHFEGELRVADKVHSLALSNDQLLVAIGGDNSITYSVMHSLFGDDLKNAGLITLDAHFDLRDGISNGSPVRRLIDAGLRGENIVQIGINDFSNSPAYAALARDLGIRVIPRSALRTHDIAEVMRDAIDHLESRVSGIYVDIDVDVCDRSVVPACPAAAPGGLSADELRQAAFIAGNSASVRAIDLTEIDASKDSADERTVRLASLCLLEIAAGRLALRRQ